MCNYFHYNGVIMSAMASQNIILTIVYSTVIQAQIKKHKKSASLAFVRGIHGWLVNSPQKGPVTRKMFPFIDVIMFCMNICSYITVYLAFSRKFWNCFQWIWTQTLHLDAHTFSYGLKQRIMLNRVGTATGWHALICYICANINLGLGGSQCNVALCTRGVRRVD